MSRSVVVDMLWLVAACAVVTWMDGVLRFIGLVWLVAQVVDLGRRPS